MDLSVLKFIAMGLAIGFGVIGPGIGLGLATKAIIESDIFLADITNNDPGVLVELGIAIATKKHIICVNSDIRLKDASYYEIPTYGFNHYVLGGIYEYGILVNSFEEAILEVEKYLKKMRQN